GICIDVVQIGVVLQIAFTRLVTGRAVECVVDEVHLENELAGLNDRFGHRRNLHAIPDLGGTRLDQTATVAENLDSTDAARTPGPQERLIAEVRNGYAG